MTSYNYIIRTLWAAAILLSLLLTACGQTKQHTDTPTDTPAKKTTADFIVEGDTGKKLDSLLAPVIQKALASHSVPGMAIGVVYQNKIVYAKGFGYKNINGKEPVTMSSIFHMASISKPFSATAIMQLAEQGKIDLDAPVTTYLPYFKLADENYKKITVRQMLGHDSGMDDSGDYQWDKPQYDAGALERYVRSIAEAKMIAAPGEKFRYSNVAFEVLGDVIAKLSGMSFADYQKKHILDKTGMKESTFLKPEHLPKNWAAPHARTLKVFTLPHYPYNRRHGPSSTLHSSAVEMCNWALINLNRGTFAGNKILDAASYDILQHPRVKIGADSSARNHIGLSWFLKEYKGEKTVGHSGSDAGFMTNFVMLPGKSVAVVVMANTMPAPIEEITNTALDIILGHEMTPIKPWASAGLWKILEEKGLDSAVQHWQALKKDHADDYDFGVRQFFNLYFAVENGKVEDAKTIARVCKAVLPAKEFKYLENIMKYLAKKDPANRAVVAVLEIFKKPA
ncbi:MAG: beta-lactamase family protein [bacterium]|nr:beta-lactamase family protein [bacterium]